MNDPRVQRLIDEGKIIEAGWLDLRLKVINDDAPSEQLDDMRMSFFSGAIHLFKLSIALGESDHHNAEIKIKMVQNELEAFIEAMNPSASPPGGWLRPDS